MSDLIVFRSLIEKKLIEAEQQVIRHRETLASIDEMLNGEEIQSQPHVALVALKKGGKESFTKKASIFILGLEGEFNNRGLALTLMNQFPEMSGISENRMKDKVASVVSRLKQEGKVVIVHKGVGSEPNIYKVSSEEDGDDFLLGIEDENTEDK